MKFPNQEKWLYLVHLLVSRYSLWFRGKGIQRDKQLRLVCVKWDEIGDMVTCVHAFRLLKAEYPNSHITVFCKPFVKSLLIAESSIDEIHTDLSDLSRVKSDIWVEFRGTFYSLFRSLISGSQLILTRGYVRYYQRGNQPHERITNARIIAPILNPELQQLLSFDSSKAQLKQALDALQKFVGLKTNNLAKQLAEQRAETLQKFVAIQTNDESKALTEQRTESNIKFALIHPGGRSLLRRWNTNNFKEIQKYLFENHGCISLVLGSNDEKSLVEELTTESFTQAWISEDSLLVLLEVIQKASIFIGNESGPLQIADLTDTPAIGLFGPGVPDVFYPSHPKSKVLHYVLDCNPCDQITCVRPNDRCIDRISIEEVKLAIDSILG